MQRNARHDAYVLEDVNFCYADAPVLRDVSFTVRSGDFFVITGPNGAGKSTLLSVMAGVCAVRAGSRIELEGRDLQSMPRREISRTIALVSQNTDTDAPFSVKDIVAMGRTPHQGLLGLGNGRDAQRVREAMRATGVEHLAGRDLRRLSGGERKRALIARALCQEPRILLLDEPTSALDLKHKAGVMDLLERLRREQGLTVIMVTHDLSMAGMYGRSVLVLKDGRVAASGTPQEVFRPQVLEPVYECRLLVNELPPGMPFVLPAPGGKS